MKAYSFDNQGLYTGEVERQYDELDRIWLMPAGATDKTPPVKDGEIAVWNGSKWELKDDNSGIYYDIETGQKIIINSPLDDISKLTKTIPADGIFPVFENGKWANDIIKQKEYDNNIIKSDLIKIDMERIRPLSEINNPDILDNKIASDKLKALEKRAQELRKQLK